MKYLKLFEYYNEKPGILLSIINRLMQNKIVRRINEEIEKNVNKSQKITLNTPFGRIDQNIEFKLEIKKITLLSLSKGIAKGTGIIDCFFTLKSGQIIQEDATFSIKNSTIKFDLPYEFKDMKIFLREPTILITTQPVIIDANLKLLALINDNNLVIKLGDKQIFTTPLKIQDQVKLAFAPNPYVYRLSDEEANSMR